MSDTLNVPKIALILHCYQIARAVSIYNIDDRIAYVEHQVLPYLMTLRIIIDRSIYYTLVHVIFSRIVQHAKATCGVQIQWEDNE